uniref:chloride transport protein 6 isoform X1 n=1 Tax=Ciona intestinalis TaxID=7719 RepID=UPI000180C6CA|nr:chloride transport protein 6 isoform X1 [Ciona intestinalis]|eukprot:XP_002124075.1 chloride transport protein 6 isoform X1 [Ciona intestinalis]
MPSCFNFNCCHRCRSSSDSEVLEPLIQQPLASREHSVHCKDYESLDYDKCYNTPYREHIKNHGKWFETKKEILSWVSIFIIGFCTALVAFGIDTVIRYLTAWKLTTVTKSMGACKHDSCIATSLLLLAAFNLSFVFIAALLVVYGEPLAAGSGIPEIKCYLNGVKVQNVTRLKTLFCKAVGVLFSVSGGLLVGKEGPMIHSGGVIGAGIPQFESLTIKGLKLNIPYFRSDRDKRDFVSAGAAAGVAAAFGAPIGGVLFSLEEGCSFWNQALTWKTLFCTMTSTFTLNFFLSGTFDHSWGSFNQNGLLTFGVFQCPPSNKNCHLWTLGDLLIFIIIGAGGGLFGMVFNAINTKLTLFRLKYLAKKHKLFRVLEVLAVAFMTTLVVFLSPLVGKCKPISAFPNNTITLSFKESGQNASLQRFLCPVGEYNDMATLFYNGQEIAIKQLFHNNGEFSLETLGLFFILFFFLSCWTYGSSVPSGLFVPCILCGAAYGRFVASFLHNYLDINHIYLGTFSLIGAAAFLGGVVRMTISLTVILIECTNEISLSLPIMVTLMVAKWAGDMANHGLYDIHIFLKSVPLLEWEVPIIAKSLTAVDIMNTRLKFIFPHTRVRSIVNLLRTTAHNSFPVVTMETVDREPKSTLSTANLRYRSSSHVTRMQVERERARTRSQLETELVEVDLSDEDTSEEGSMCEKMSSNEDSNGSSGLADNLQPMTFHGIILRTQLTTLLKNNIYHNQYSGASTQEVLSYEKFNEDYPRFMNIHDMNMDDLNLNEILDVTPYMHPCPHIVHPDSPVPQVFNLFRTMGLRHLPVINSRGEVLGWITRHNLTHEFIEEIVKIKSNSRD